jgi:hypothetical protein
MYSDFLQFLYSFSHEFVLSIRFSIFDAKVMIFCQSTKFLAMILHFTVLFIIIPYSYTHFCSF